MTDTGNVTVDYPPHPDFYPFYPAHTSVCSIVATEPAYPKGNPNISSDIPERIAVSERSLGTVYRISHTPSDIAFDALRKLDALPDCLVLKTYSKLSRDFCIYLDACESKKFLVKGYDTKSGTFVNAPLDYDNRWMPSNRRALSHKLDILEWWFDTQQNNPVTVISLTSYHTGNIRKDWDNLNKSRDLLLKILRKYYPGIDYFWVPEPHKSGYIHYHLALFADVSNRVKDGDGEGMEDKLRRLWSEKYGTGSHTYGLDFTQKEDNQKIKGLKDYLTKYLRKGFLLGEWTPELLIFNALLWDSKYRMYGASKNISAIMKIEPIKHEHTVWLETKLDDGIDNKIVYYRQYIPEWLDSCLWLNSDGHIRIIEPDPTYIYDWGRRASDKRINHIYRWKERGKFEDITYKDFNQKMAQKYNFPTP